MGKSLNPAAVVGILLAIVAFAAYPVWRWFSAPAVERESLPRPTPLRGTILEPVALNLALNPKQPAPGGVEGDVTFLPELPGRFAPLVDADRKAMKKQIDEYLRGTGLPMDQPTMTTGAKPNGVFLTAEVRPTVNADASVSIYVSLRASKQVEIRHENTDAMPMVVLEEVREGRVAAADTKKGIVAVTKKALDGVVQRWRDQNPK